MKASEVAEAIGGIILAIVMLAVSCAVVLLPFALIAAVLAVMVLVFRWITGI